MSPAGDGNGRAGDGGPLYSRFQILAARRRAQALDERLAQGALSLRTAAWAGLQDSMPRAALLSISARVEGTRSDALDDPALVQVWGPRYSTYAVAADDVAVFTLGRLPAGGVRRARALDMATRLASFLDGEERPIGEAARALGVHPTALRYAAPAGTVLIRWDGARQPTVRTAAAPDMESDEARLELARRHLRVFGPTTPAAFDDWAGTPRAEAVAAYAALRPELVPVRTPIGDAWILAEDEPRFTAQADPPAPARLLPSGDTFFLLQGAERDLLVPDPRLRARLWTSRVWPGAVLVDGEIAGTWRRAGSVVEVDRWRPLSASERDAVEAEAAGMPLPGGNTIGVRWARGPGTAARG